MNGLKKGIAQKMAPTFIQTIGNDQMLNGTAGVFSLVNL
jgi:hypothetical protein